jgi:hypothetical protein
MGPTNPRENEVIIGLGHLEFGVALVKNLIDLSRYWDPVAVALALGLPHEVWVAERIHSIDFWAQDVRKVGGQLGYNEMESKWQTQEEFAREALGD